MRIDVWSDLVCPWCYVGKRRFERALAAAGPRDDIQIVHRAYLLYGAYPRGTTFDRREMLVTKYGVSGKQADAMNAGMVQTAAAEGLEYHLEGGVTGNTFDAHRIVLFAQAQGRQNDMLERLYRAFFTEQRSIFDRSSLTELASEAGFDREAVGAALRDDSYAEAVKADTAQAVEIGVTGVPFFVFDGRFAVSGAQKTDIFVKALTHAAGSDNQFIATTK